MGRWKGPSYGVRDTAEEADDVFVGAEGVELEGFTFVRSCTGNICVVLDIK